jgi:hypothetical protein
VAAEVGLRDITGETVRAVCRLQVAPGQARFVAANAVSIPQAHFEPKAWLRVIYAEGGPEGFYKRFGFVDTGEVEDGEVVCRLPLGRPAPAEGDA